MATTQEILAQVAGYGEQIIEAQRRLVAVPALGPTNGGPRASWPRPSCFRAGWTPRTPGWSRVSGPTWWPPCPGAAAPKVWVLSHLDVVPVGDLALWSGDPWSLRVEGDRLYGRGVNDNGHGLVASFFGVKALVSWA